MKDYQNASNEYGEKRLEKRVSERPENDTLPGIDNMTEEQWRMFADTVE